MSHPFEVGKTYRNRVGEYVVLAIEEDKIKIRYVDGGTLETDVQTQSRIWENIQFEERASRAEERRRLAQEARLAARQRTRQIKAKPEYSGFQAGDFESRARGIAWQNRQILGRLLSFELRKRTKAPFSHWIVPRQPEIHLAHRDYYNREARERNSAFFVTVAEEGVTYGLQVGKPAGATKPTWAWTRTLAALAEGEQMQSVVRATLEKYDLSLNLYTMQTKYGLVGQITPAHEGGEFLWRHETADQEIVRPMDWDRVVEEIQSVTAEERSDLRIAKQLPPGEAVERGSEIVDELVSVFRGLLPVYETSIGL